MTAQVASDTHGLAAIRIHVQARRSAVALSHLRPLQGILLGVDLFRILVPEGYGQSLKQIYQEDAAKYVGDGQSHRVTESSVYHWPQAKRLPEAAGPGTFFLLLVWRLRQPFYCEHAVVAASLQFTSDGE